MNEFGEFLRDLRGKRSLREMERLTGLSHTYLSSLEKGADPRSGKERKPTPEALKKISEAFPEVKYMELMRKAGYIKTFGQTLKEFREEKGWSFEDLERETINFEYGTPIFISKKRLKNLENDIESDPSIFEIYLLSQAFTVHPWNFPTTNITTPQQDLVEFLETDDKPDPISFMDKLLDSLYKKLVDSIKSKEDNDVQLDISKRIQGIKDNKKRYIEQLNSLSANGEYVIKEDSVQPILEEIKFEQDYISDQHISFAIPNKTDELEFFDLCNLLNLGNKINYKGKLLSASQKQEIYEAIEKIIE